MKKTFTINISGSVFNIDDDAYDLLKNYLAQINEKFESNPNREKIINNIEARLSQLFRERISYSANVITHFLVEEVIGTMGIPDENIGTEENNTSSGNAQQTPPPPSYTKTTKRLYRDSEFKVFGGVCSGLAYYLNISKVLIRILFFILIFPTSGAMILAYFILWIAVPRAVTPSQRLEMKGQPVNAENIGKTINEDSRSGKSYKEGTKNNQGTPSKREDNIFSRLFGGILFAFGIISLLAIIIGFFVASQFIGMLPVIGGDWYHGSFMNHIVGGEYSTLFLISLFLIVGIPFMMITYAGTKLLFNFEANSRQVLLSAAGVWILGIIIAVATSVGAIDMFSTDASAEETKSLPQITSDTIYITTDKEKKELISSTRIETNNFQVVVINGKEHIVGRPKFDIQKSSNQQFELEIRKNSRGNNRMNAKRNSEDILYEYRVNANTLTLDPFFQLNKEEEWRNQNMSITLDVPIGKIIYLDESLQPIIHNIQNTSNTWDGDMVNRYWVMTDNGLQEATKRP
jgi:phage shock protein PspC (stress-responsive transcriptional regulator)